MEFCKNRIQQKTVVKIVFGFTLIIGIICLMAHFRNESQEEQIKTCEPTISVRRMGQFGNQVWEYMSLYAIWQMNYKLFEEYHLTPYIGEDLKVSLENLFENLTIQPFPKIYHHCDEKETITVLKEKPFRLPKDMSRRNVILDSYSARYEDVIKYGIDNIKKELKFKQNYVDDVMKTFNRIRKEKNRFENDTTFIGMHYRGGDYIPHLEGHHGRNFKGPPNYSYYISAMNYFQTSKKV